MKILFVITCNGPGKGGHYHSLDHISRAIGAKYEVKIVSIGLNESEVLKENPYFFKHIYFRLPYMLKLWVNFKNVLSSVKPDVIHSFDSTSQALIAYFNIKQKPRMVSTQCGGRNERKFLTPVPNTQILFSKENFDWYNSNKRFNHTELFQIPNRVYKVDLCDHIPYPKNEHIFTFVRIGRIVKNYKNSLLQALNLIDLLNKNNINGELILIGYIGDFDLYEDLVKIIKSKKLAVQFITNEYTAKASQLLYLADAVIGTGRGVMEAMSIGLPALAPSKNSDLPVLVNDLTFDKLASKNFSERIDFTEEELKKNQKLIKQIVLNKETYRNVSILSSAIATEHFLITDYIVEKYSKIYFQTIAKKRICIFLYLILNVIPVLYRFNMLLINYKKIKTII